MTPDDLQKILDAHDAEACLAFFEAATEAQRRTLAKRAAERLRSLTTGPFDHLVSMITQGSLGDWPKSLPDPPPLEAIRTAQIAVLATATLGGLKKLGSRALPPIDDAVRVLKARRPAWVREWAEAMLSGKGAFRNPIGLADNWRFVRRLIREGLCERLHGPEYINGMIRGILTHRPDEDLYEALRNDPNLLEEEVWEIFETEPEPGNLGSLSTDPWQKENHRWDLALVRLANEGQLSRARLLDASLGALERDYHEARARWFALMQESLEPTLDEQAERAGRYLGLLASHNASTVSFALKTLNRLDSKNRLDPRAVLDAVGPALQARAKTTVLSALKRIDRAAAKEASLAPRAARVAAEALAHESPSVHETVVEMVERLGDRSDREFLEFLKGRVELVAPSQRERLARWVGMEEVPKQETDAPADLDELRARAGALDPSIAERAGVTAALKVLEEGGGSVPAIDLDEMELCRLDPERLIEPVKDVDELVGLFLRVLEDPERIDDVERVLDGVSRLCDRRPEDFEERTEPLKARAQQPQTVISWCYAPLARLALGWITGRFAHINTHMHGPTFSQVFALRVLDLALRAADRQPGPLASAPTHEGGWIDPRVLVERVRECSERSIRIDRVDGALALLRLAPDRAARAEALRAAGGLEGPFAAALRHALGGEGEEIGPDARIWAAAARARTPREDDERVEARHPGLGPDAGRAARCSLKEGPLGVYLERWRRRPSLIACDPPRPQEVSNEWPIPVLFHHPDAYWGSLASKWVASVWPMGRDAFFAMGADELLGIECSPSESAKYRPYLEALLDPDVPLREMGRFLLAGGLSSNRPELQGLAVDGVTLAFEDGRLDGRGLGMTLCRLLKEGLAKRTRVAKALGDVARVSPLHAREVATAVQHALAGVSEAFRDLHWMLELLKELLIETEENLSVRETETALRGLRIGGKTGQLIRDLVNQTGAVDPANRRASAEWALRGRLERAERWMWMRLGFSRQERPAELHEVPLDDRRQVSR